MQRISIIGCCGAGKSTLSKKLHTITRLPLIHLDREFWSAGWTPSDKEDFQRRIKSLCEMDQWIIDGHYFSTMDLRLERSDYVFYLDYSTPLCLFRVFKRMVLGLGRERSDCAERCHERFDWKFISYVASFRRKFRARTVGLLEKHKHLQVNTFRNPRELQDYLNEVENKL